MTARRCAGCKWRTAVGCPSRTGQGCSAWEAGDCTFADQLVTVLCVCLLAGAMFGAHVAQGMRIEMDALEAAQEALDQRMVAGWWHRDPVTLQLYFEPK